MKKAQKKTTLTLPRAGTRMRKVADALVGSRGWYTPPDSAHARCAQTLRDTSNWPIEDEVVAGQKYHRYKIDPERRPHYEFV